MNEPHLFQRTIHSDNRGLFAEIWEEDFPWSKLGLSPAQENVSISRRRVFRGMHWQLPPFEQGKLVTVLTGAIRDFVVDVRKSSNLFCKLQVFELDGRNMQSLWVPPGFAHGFESLEDDTVVVYQLTNKWSPEHERSFSYISLGELTELDVEDLLLSSKDSAAAPLAGLDSGDFFD